MIQVLGKHDLQFGVEIARLAVSLLNSLSLGSQTRAAGGARGNLQGDGSVRRGNVDLRAEGRFCHRDRNLDN